MPLLVHIAPVSAAKSIRRNGIAPSRLYTRDNSAGRFVWAFPVLPSYTLTHSWSRELKRSGTRTLVAVTFRVGDDEPVLAEHYRNPRQQMTAAEAVARIRDTEDPRGTEIMIPRRIRPSEIVRIRVLPEAVGWRYAPTAKNRYPCDCPMCLPKGEVNARRYRERIGLIREKWNAKAGS
jgi:hypothetical protein